MTDQGKRYRAADIERFLASAFVALKVPEDDAKSVAHLMVKADLYGYETHGTFRLRQYANEATRCRKVLATLGIYVRA